MIIVSAKSGGDVRHVLIARLGLDQKATRDVDEASCPREVTQ